jgi:phytoene synthase
LEQFGYTETELLALKNTAEFQSLMRYEANVARSHYKRALELLPTKWHRELRPARIMGRIYLTLLNKIERRDFPVLFRKTTLNWFELAGATCAAL